MNCLRRNVKGMWINYQLEMVKSELISKAVLTMNYYKSNWYVSCLI